jgi:hypothetical protein
MSVKKVLKTAGGVLAGSIAVDAFELSKEVDEPGPRLALKAIGSLAAATSFHILKNDATDIVGDVAEKIGRVNRTKLLK